MSGALEKVHCPEAGEEAVKEHLREDAASDVLFAASEEEGVGVPLDEETAVVGGGGVVVLGAEGRHIINKKDL